MIKFTLVLALCGAAFASHWSYKDQKAWPGQCNDAAFQMTQSPININSLCSGSNQTFKVPTTDEAAAQSMRFKFVNWEKNLGVQPWNIANNGHSAQLSLLGGNKKITWAPAPITQNPFSVNSDHQLAQLHFHWHESDDNGGTEHAIDGKRHALELHLVHYDITAPNPDTPSMVLGVLFEVSEHDNPALQPVVGRLSTIENTGDSTWLEDGIVLDNLLPKNREHFYYYSGSLTTPNCNFVQWYVFSEIQKIGRAQLAAFRKLKDAEGKPISNIRDLQQASLGRMVIVPFDDGCKSWPKAVPTGPTGRPQTQDPTTKKPSWWRTQFNKLENKAKGFLNKLH